MPTSTTRSGAALRTPPGAEGVRIVAGTARGRRLAAPAGEGTRPTSDKVRGSIFNILGQFFEGGRVLDLYSGTGSLALEALSRGYADATCVEASPGAADAILENAAACGFAAKVTVVRRRVEAALPMLPPGSFDLAFVDPPYSEGPDAALSSLDRVLRPGALVVAEHDRRSPPPERVGSLVVLDRRTYGDTGISIYRRE
jgi:16S rRNA (guanine966-N2)-methyltransferase